MKSMMRFGRLPPLRHKRGDGGFSSQLSNLGLLHTEPKGRDIPPRCVAALTQSAVLTGTVRRLDLTV
jgi:hypothetical protein